MTESGVATVATVGTFDGIHRGHQAVLREVVRRAEQAGRRTSLLVTFDPHPLEVVRSEEHTSELQSRLHLVCRLLLEKKKKKTIYHHKYVIPTLPHSYP